MFIFAYLYSSMGCKSAPGKRNQGLSTECSIITTGELVQYLQTQQEIKLGLVIRAKGSQTPTYCVRKWSTASSKVAEPTSLVRWVLRYSSMQFQLVLFIYFFSVRIFLLCTVSCFVPSRHLLIRALKLYGGGGVPRRYESLVCHLDLLVSMFLLPFLNQSPSVSFFPRLICVHCIPELYAGTISDSHFPVCVYTMCLSVAF